MTAVSVFCIRVLTVLFFTGLAGCSIVVLLSWISICRSEFSGKGDSEPAEDHNAPHSTPPRPSQANRIGHHQAFSDPLQSSSHQSLMR